MPTAHADRLLFPLPTQVYPIWAAVGGALCITTFFVTRQISTSPGFRYVGPPPRAPR